MAKKGKKIEVRFGLTVEANRDIPKDKYTTLHRQISASLASAGVEPKKVKVYIHHISLHAAPHHLRVGPISKRMTELSITLSIPKEAQRKRHMRFLNHRLGVVYQSEVEVSSRDYSIQYVLKGEYCDTHTEFDDYLALLVEDTCPEKFKQLNMSITAYATPEFGKKWINDTQGFANTKLVFPLSQDIQLTF